MNTDFLFDNIIIFPLIALIVIVTYIIQFCSVISPCNIEFDGNNDKEMCLMNRYNHITENAFTIYISAVSAGIVVSILMASSIVLMMLMIVQVIYLMPALFVMFTMYSRNKKYWQNYQCIKEYENQIINKYINGYRNHDTNSGKETLTAKANDIYNCTNVI